MKFSFVAFVVDYTCSTIDSCHCVGWTFCYYLEAKIEHPFCLLGSYQIFGWIFSLRLHHRSCLLFLDLGLPRTALGPRLLSLSLCLVECFRLDVSVIFPFMQDVSKVLRQDSKVGYPTPKRRENFVSLYVRKHFSRYGPTTYWPQSPRFLSVWTFKYPSVYRCNCKWRHTSPWRFFLVPVKPVLTSPGTFESVTVHDQSPWAHWFRRRTFWEFVVNCDLLNSMNSAVLKMRTYTENVLCQL